MGVVKNLMVRIGADVRGVVNGMKSARSATYQASDGIKRSTKEAKRSIIDSFTAPVKAIKEYSDDIARTKAAHQAATQNVEILTEKITKMEETYGTIKNATDGLDLSKPFSEIKNDAENNLVKIQRRMKEVEAELKNLDNSTKKKNSSKYTSLQAELSKLAEKSLWATKRLEDLDRIEDLIGTSNIGMASNTGLRKMQEEIINARNELETTKAVAAETGARLQSLKLGPTLLSMLKSVGSAASQAAGNGIKKLGSALKNLAAGAVRGIVSLPGKLLNIGKSASAGCGGLGKMVRSIRNIGIASLGMRVATGMFGRMRSIISSYIYQNEALNKSVTSLRNQMGEALAPVINMALVAMQRLMPVVTAVSNAINSLFAALFGKAKSTSAAIASTAEAASDAAESLDVYGFDQITKVSDNTGSGSGSVGASITQQAGEQSALVQKLTNWIKQLKAAFVADDWEGLGKIVGDGINNAVNAINAVDIGGRAGMFANNLFTALHSALETTDFSNIGATAGRMTTIALGKVDWKVVGEVLGMGLLALPAVGVGFVLGADWAVIGQSISECLSGVLQSVTEWIRGVDWLQLGQCASTLIANVDWGLLTADLFTFFGTALGAGVSLLWGFIGDAVANIKEYFTKKIQECGGNVAMGLLKGILDGLGNIVGWVNKNVVSPFVSGFNSIKTGAVNAFSGLWTGVKGWINKVIGGVESMANWVIKGINGLIGAFNDVAQVGSYFGLNLQIEKMSNVYLPRLAKGTVVDEPTVAMIGEAGKEVVMPLENNTGWITKLAQQINQAGGNKVTTLALPIYFRSRKLAEYVIQDINQIGKENGVCPIYV